MKKNSNNKQNNKVKSLVSQIHDIMLKEDLTKVLWEEKDNFRILVKRKNSNQPVAIVQTDQPEPESEPAKDYIKSPMNGIYYSSPSPNAKPFIKENDIVESGKTVCIIGAMKLMNEVQVERTCKIIKILVDNGVTIEVNQPLFEIEIL